MKKTIFFLLCSCGLLFMQSCSEDLGSSSIVVPVTDPEKMNPLDRYIYDEYTKPLNVEVIYRWRDAENDLDKSLVPPKADKVEPFLKVLKKVWVDVYVRQAGNDFLRQLIPKQILLVGSAAYNEDGTRVVGKAEGGRKIFLYEVNEFNPSSDARLRDFVATMHHEFGHIMHQTVEFSTDYQKITPGGYTSDWNQYSDAQALEEGFITSYAKNNQYDDFVEMLSIYLINSSESWNKKIDAVKSETGRAALRQKESLVLEYMNTVWGVKMKEFQADMDNAIKEVVKGNIE